MQVFQDRPENCRDTDTLAGIFFSFIGRFLTDG